MLHALTSPGVWWYASPAILEEYLAVLARPRFDLEPSILTEWKNTFSSCLTLIAPEENIALPRDPTDEKFLACAIAAGADILVTGDRDFSEAKRFLSTTVMSVSMYNRLLLSP